MTFPPSHSIAARAPPRAGISISAFLFEQLQECSPLTLRLLSNGTFDFDPSHDVWAKATSNEGKLIRVGGVFVKQIYAAEVLRNVSHVLIRKGFLFHVRFYRHFFFFFFFHLRYVVVYNRDVPASRVYSSLLFSRLLCAASNRRVVYQLDANPRSEHKFSVLLSLVSMFCMFPKAKRWSGREWCRKKAETCFNY